MSLRNRCLFPFSILTSGGKRRGSALARMSSALLFMAGTMAADPQYVVEIGELGTGSFQPFGGASNTIMPLDFTLAHDPMSPPGFPAVPRFSSPAALANQFTEKISVGDVVIEGPGIFSENPSDLVRFEHVVGLPGGRNGGANAIFFYSDIDGDKDISDVGIPPVGTLPIIRDETIPCPALPPPFPCNGPPGTKPGTVVYDPTALQPGGLATDAITATRYEYIIHSDCSSDGACNVPTPEPSVLSLTAPVLGALLLLFGSRRSLSNAGQRR